METKEIGGALAGALIATSLLETLVAKEILTIANARHLVLKAIQAVEGPFEGRPTLSPEAQAAVEILRSLLNRFSENK